MKIGSDKLDVDGLKIKVVKNFALQVRFSFSDTDPFWH